MPDTSSLAPAIVSCSGGLVLNRDVFSMSPGEALELKNFEPDIALTDNDDGLEFYRRFCDISSQLMNRKSFMILEVGLGQHPLKVHNIFSLAGFNKLELIPDYNNDLRVLKIQI